MNGSLSAYNMPLLGATFAACGALAGFAKFGKGYNVMWLAGSFAPFATMFIYQRVKQPE